MKNNNGWKAKEIKIKQLNLIETDFRSSEFSSSFSGRKKLKLVGIWKSVKDNDSSSSWSSACPLLRSGYFLVQCHKTRLRTGFSFNTRKDQALSPLTLVLRIWLTCHPCIFFMSIFSVILAHIPTTMFS